MSIRGAKYKEQSELRVDSVSPWLCGLVLYSRMSLLTNHAFYISLGSTLYILYLYIIVYMINEKRGPLHRSINNFTVIDLKFEWECRSYT